MRKCACLAVFAGFAMGSLLSYGGRDCKFPGCGRYANTTGYCGLHRDEAKREQAQAAQAAKSRAAYKATPERAVPKTPIPPDEPLFGDRFVSDASRQWTDSRGKKIDARLCHVSEDGQTVYLKSDKTQKMFQLKLTQLSQKDRDHVNDTVKSLKAADKVWLKGIYVDKSEKSEHDKKAAARQTIIEKDRIAGEVVSLKVFQVLGNNDLCNALCWARFAQTTDELRGLVRTPFRFIASKKGFLSDGDLIAKRFYWCGTYYYPTRSGDDRTIHCLTDDLDFAICYLTEQMNRGHSSAATKGGAEAPKPAGAPRLKSTGSGFFITKDGFLVTNHHVVNGGSSFAVKMHDGERDARVVFSDSETDLALLKVDGIQTKPFVFSRKRTEGLGATIITMGFPRPGLQGFEPKVTKGVISGERGFMGDVREYQIDASVQPGNSGGPLFNEQGQLVGVVVASLRDGQVVNYAIKKSYLQAFLDNSSECSAGIVEAEGTGPTKSLEDVVSDVRDSCVLVLNYR